MRSAGWMLATLTAAFVFAAVATTTPADPALFPPAPDGPSVEIVVADHGIHVAMILPLPEVARVASERGLPSLIAVAQRFGAYDHLEFGWGDEDVYRLPPGFDGRWLGGGARALLGLNSRTVMYVGGIIDDPVIAVAHSGPMRLRLSQEGFTRLLTGLETGFASEGGQPLVIATGNSGPSLFYRGAGRYSAFNVCNHWTSRLLASAGVPVSSVPDTFSPLLMLDLRLRAGAKPVVLPDYAPAP